MPGFLGYISHPRQPIFPANTRKDLINDYVRHENKFYLERRTIDKFQQDKFVYEDNNMVFILDGVILNTQEICRKQKTNSFQDAIITLYKKQKQAFLTELRGSFSGAIYNKKNNELALFTDQIGSRPIFYYSGKDCFIFGSEIRYVTDSLQHSDIVYGLNIESAYSLLTLGYTIEGRTLFTSIHQLKPGQILFINDTKIYYENYFILKNEPDFSLKETEILEQIDFLFRQAVTRAFNKDEEYGYKHLACLSAGLDSRMTNWVAHDLGYRNILNVSFSQSGYYDEYIPQKIAEQLKNDWLFKSLDNGNCLYLIDEVIRITSGTLYYGSAHLRSIFNIIDMDQYGLVHTGQLGDVVLGTYYSSLDVHKNFSSSTGAYSVVLQDRLPANFIRDTYANEEIYIFYSRGFCGINQGLFVRQQKNETYSPFYDIDFMNFSLSIPVKYRFGHYIYDKWILQKYPEAAKFLHNGKRKIGYSNRIKMTYKGYDFYLSELPRLITGKIKYKIKGSPLSNKHHMNPIEYWYRTNISLKTFLDNYFKDNIDRLDQFPELKADCEKLYTDYSCIERNAVLTLLAVMKNYF